MQNEGGPAFAGGHNTGMTLRQWYAGQALAGLLAARPDTPADDMEVVEAAFRLAHAMVEYGYVFVPHS